MMNVEATSHEYAVWDNDSGNVLYVGTAADAVTLIVTAAKEYGDDCVTNWQLIVDWPVNDISYWAGDVLSIVRVAQALVRA